MYNHEQAAPYGYDGGNVVATLVALFWSNSLHYYDNKGNHDISGMIEMQMDSTSNCGVNSSH